jgi:hypothetical protein
LKPSIIKRRSHCVLIVGEGNKKELIDKKDLPNVIFAPSVVPKNMVNNLLGFTDVCFDSFLQILQSMVCLETNGLITCMQANR